MSSTRPLPRPVIAILAVLALALGGFIAFLIPWSLEQGRLNEIAEIGVDYNIVGTKQGNAIAFLVISDGAKESQVTLDAEMVKYLMTRPSQLKLTCDKTRRSSPVNCRAPKTTKT